MYHKWMQARGRWGKGLGRDEGRKTWNIKK